MSIRPRLSRAAWGLAAAGLVFFVATAPGYGYFRDELYYLANGEHLAWGYVEHPPFIGLVAALVRATLGESLYAIRLPAAIAAAATMLVTARLAAEFGGGRFAQALAALSLVLMPVALSLFTILSMNAFDLLAWAVAYLVIVRALRTGNGRAWVALGVIAGIGLQNKISVLFLGAGLVAGLAFARRWDVFRTRAFWAGGAVALAIFAPYVIWQAAHGWPLLEFMENARREKNVAFSPAAFLLAQMLQIAGPMAWALATAGFLWLVAGHAPRDYRAVGWAYPAIAATMILAGGAKPYYLAPVYPVLLAAGAVAVESWTARRVPPSSPGAGLLVRAVLVAALLASGALVAPLAKPLLPVDTYVRYASALGVTASAEERHRLGRLPQHFADMHGWPELAAAVGRVFASLPAADRTGACVFAQNYGEAGAIDLFGARHGLPKAISGHNSYFLWGPRGCTGDVMIVLGGDRESLEAVFEHVEQAAAFTCTDCMPYESDQPIWIARRLRRPLAEIWPAVKRYI